MVISGIVMPSAVRRSLTSWYDSSSLIAPQNVGELLPAAGFLLSPPGATPDWQHACVFTIDAQQKSVHFLLDAVDVVDDQLHAISCEWYIASDASRHTGTYDLKIVIDQNDKRCNATIFDAQGTRLTGIVPRLSQSESRAWFLPWRDGMRLYYSVIVEEREGRPTLLVVQHAKTPVSSPRNRYLPGDVGQMLSTYAVHERLYNRTGAYLENADHMRVLELPLSHESYAVLTASGDVSVSFAVTKGAIRITPA